MRPKIIILFSVMFLGLVRCGTRSNQPTIFIRDIPDFKNGHSLRLEGLSHSRDSLQLDTLEYGYDSIQIRLWVTYAIKDTFQIVSIKRHKNQWSGVYCETALHYSMEHDSILYYTKWEKPLYPKTGWQPFVDSLIKLNILILPDCTKIKGYDFPFDGGNSVTFEISTVGQYRLYMYQLPGLNKNHFKEAANVDNILKLVSYEFGIRYLGTF
jgi:hypothetical protein